MADGKSLPQRRTGEMHKGRVSLTGARYFITCTVDRRLPVLRQCSDVLDSALARLGRDGDITIQCGTIMPDHLHLCVTLNGRLSVGQVVGKMKTLTRAGLAQASARWQRDVFEHRLRPEERIDPYARYVFLNPYRGGLVALTERWPHWFCHDPSQCDFVELLDSEGCPPVEWIECDLAGLGLQESAIGE